MGTLDDAPERDDALTPVRFVGRAAEIARAVEALHQGGSLVVRGKAGIGKRALLGEVRQALEREGRMICLWPSVATAKQMIADLAEQTHNAIGLEVPERMIPPRFRAAAHRTGRIEFRHIKRTLLREPIAEQTELVMRVLRERPDVVVFVESLELAPTQADILHQLAEHVQLAAAIEDTNRRHRIMRLLWRFQVVLELKALSKDETRRWVSEWLREHPVEFESPRVRKAFETAVVRDSGGIPAAIDGMLAGASAEREVTRSVVRRITHDAATTYLDLTPLLILCAAALMALRYISRGMGVQELMVFAGVGTSVFWVILYFARMMQSRR
jgi:hypothetical protein